MDTLSFAEIARIEEARQARGTADVSTEAQAIAGGWMCFSGPGTWWNQASGLGLAGPVTDDELDELVDFFVARRVEPRIEVCPYVDATLTEGLAKRGFLVREFENVLARELHADEDLGALLTHAPSEEVEVVEVDPTDADQAREYVEVATSGFRPLDKPMDPELFEIARRVLDHPVVTGYLALVDGQPAGGGAMEVRGKGSALFGASVLPAFRKRGIQQTMIIRRLEQARTRGARIAAIQSVPGMSTERNARRMGFFLAYTKVILVRPLETVEGGGNGRGELSPI